MSKVSKVGKPLETSIDSTAPAPMQASGTLAESIADRIEADVVRAHWPIGAVLGSEEQLVERFQVGRAVLREVARLLAERGVARRRPGPGGGLTVTAPHMATVLDRARLFLDYRDVQPDDLFEALRALEGSQVALAARRITPAQALLLRATFDDAQSRLAETGLGQEEIILALQRIQTHIAEIAGNPAVQLFLDVVQKLVIMRRTHMTPGQVSWLLEQERLIVDAICAGDAGQAELVSRRRIEALSAASALSRHRRPPLGFEDTGFDPPRTA